MINETELLQIVNEEFNMLSQNNFKTLNMPKSPIWEPPIYGIAKGDDTYFDFLKKHIGEFHWSPIDGFKLKYKEWDKDPSKLIVLCLAFPQTQLTKASQLKETKCPSREWIVSRGEWEPLMKDFSSNVVNTLEKRGIKATSIDLIPEFHVDKTGPTGIASTWSHRHYAYAAGLGTFGLSDGLITKKGKAVRFTSFIIEADIKPTIKEYEDPYEWCLYYKDGSCGKCISRCPVCAISKENGHDKYLCLDYEDFFAENYWPEGLDKKDYILGCGLCQVGIPCESRKP